MSKKNNIEHAFDTLKCYIESYTSRASKPAQKEIASKLEDALNAIIEFYNITEGEHASFDDLRNARDMYLYLLLSSGVGRMSRDNIFEYAKGVPSEYVFNYITHEDNADQPIGRRIYNAVQSWKYLQDAKEERRREIEFIYLFRQKADKADTHEKRAFWQGCERELNKGLAETEKLIRELTY